MDVGTTYIRFFPECLEIRLKCNPEYWRLNLVFDTSNVNANVVMSTWSYKKNVIEFFQLNNKLC